MAYNSFTAEQSAKTPLINFDASTGTFELKGKSIPENSVLFYKPLFEWLDAYVQNPAPKTNLNIQLDYFNTSSSKCIVDLFKKIEQIPKNAKGEATINWMYDDQDDDMLEAGEDYKSIIKMPFNLVSFTK
ncbi:MAG: nuclear pore complex subunit [Bacteroidetes bacterium]|jgi:hypothetical protein|nr:nuclear pore complex subunit [Bacteroidota bacterium]